jgi:hypothetical protein
MRSETFCIAAAAFFLAGGLRAQPGESVSMMIDVVAWGDDIGGLSFKSGDDKGGNITARSFRYSKPIRYTGPRVLEIHKSGDGGLEPPPPISAEDKEHELIPLPAVEIEKAGGAAAMPVPERLAQLRKENPTLVSLVNLPPAARRVTILLAPAAEGTFSGYVIEDDPAKLPLGKLRVHNLSPLPIAMQFGTGKQQEMAPRQTVLVNAPEGYAAYKLAYKEGDEWKVQENNIIPVPRDEQSQLIVLRSKNQFFLSADGTPGGFLQLVNLRRKPSVETDNAP